MEKMEIGQLYHRTEMVVKDVQKRVFDVIVSLLLLALLWPILVSCMLIAWMASARPTYAKKQYAGMANLPFVIWKPCTFMSESTIRNETTLFRMVRFEKILLLYNVLKGEMSLVGPQPETIETARKYTNYQSQRLNIKPGLTGYAQIHEHMIQCYNQKIEYDLYYIQHRSIGMDCKILFHAMVLLIRRSIFLK